LVVAARRFLAAVRHVADACVKRAGDRRSGEHPVLHRKVSGPATLALEPGLLLRPSMNDETLTIGAPAGRLGTSERS
jgi:hypothetical protein